MSERVPLDLNELRPKPYPSGPSIARQKATDSTRYDRGLRWETEALEL